MPFPKEKPPREIDLSEYDAFDVFSTFHDDDGSLAFALLRNVSGKVRTVLYFTDPDTGVEHKICQPTIDDDHFLGFAELFVNVASFCKVVLGFILERYVFPLVTRY